MSTSPSQRIQKHCLHDYTIDRLHDLFKIWMKKAGLLPRLNRNDAFTMSKYLSLFIIQLAAKICVKSIGLLTYNVFKKVPSNLTSIS